MGLVFEFHLPVDKKFLCVSEIPLLTAQAIYPESGFAQAAAQINHETLLNRLIKEEYVTLLNPLTYEPHTFPFGEALRSAVITVEDFIRLAEILQIQVMIEGKLAVSPDVTGARAGLTIQEAAQAIAKKYRFSKPAQETLQKQLSNAASRGEFEMRDPATGLPYVPSIRRDFLEFVSISDLNSWLKKQGVEYRLDSPEQEQYGDDATVPKRVNNADEIPGKQPPRAVGKLAVKAAWQFECETKRRASAKEVMARLQAWADEGKEPATLIKSLKNRQAVQWLTDKNEHRQYSTEACKKTLQTWHKSRQ